jgi:hypothetical protein
MQVGITRPFVHGLPLKGHYTLSRSMALRTDYEVPIPDVQARNWALANSRRHMFQMAAVYQLPSIQLLERRTRKSVQTRERKKRQQKVSLVSPVRPV